MSEAQLGRLLAAIMFVGFNVLLVGFGITCAVWRLKK